MSSSKGPIGIFDSGVGGLTVMKDIIHRLPSYDYLYLGDSARTPYGNRSFASIYQFTLECVRYLFSQQCHLIILACNTASAKALRTIQQRDLPKIAPNKRVLGVIRPTAEVIGLHSNTGHVGVLGTTGTIQSDSYEMEIEHQFPELIVHQQACPMWVPLVENNEHNGPGADYFVEKYLHEINQQSPDIDTLLLACTHYPLLEDKIRSTLNSNISILSQGPIVAASLEDYLQRHPEIDENCSKNGSRRFLTTDAPETFDQHATTFFEEKVTSEYVEV
ncbi:glutamate racemase [Fodinibius salsisoli]|uniref:Glutamate racemase n=1 Tax=Fodinibius salsisoli TaxID=2820877 RepID=A0ABT3PRU0_9BACT|nr:glutamate racemase [Fodinibius salsisoli]MCW9708551.1 glutamate racemase [Fodinibius salsisoli]